MRLLGECPELLSQIHEDLVVTDVGYSIKSSVPAHTGSQIPLKRS